MIPIRTSTTEKKLRRRAALGRPTFSTSTNGNPRMFSCVRTCNKLFLSWTRVKSVYRTHSKHHLCIIKECENHTISLPCQEQTNRRKMQIRFPYLYLDCSRPRNSLSFPEIRQYTPVKRRTNCVFGFSFFVNIVHVLSLLDVEIVLRMLCYPLLWSYLYWRV